MASGCSILLVHIPPKCYCVKVLLSVFSFKMQKENHVFVIDDDPSVRKGLGNLMRAAGYDVSIFASAKEFLDVLSPDICGVYVC